MNNKFFDQNFDLKNKLKNLCILHEISKKVYPTEHPSVGQNPRHIASAVHFGEWLQSLGSGFLEQPVDTTVGFHTYTLEWNEFNFVFKFDGEIQFIVDLDKILQPGTYDKPGQPFDEDFYLILNCAIGGNYVEGPE